MAHVSGTKSRRKFYTTRKQDIYYGPRETKAKREESLQGSAVWIAAAWFKRVGVTMRLCGNACRSDP